MAWRSALRVSRRALSGGPLCVDSLGTGTFLSIATLDIIKTEFDSPRYRADKWGAAVLGFAIMAALAIWI